MYNYHLRTFVYENILNDEIIFLFCSKKRLYYFHTSMEEDVLLSVGPLSDW